MPYMCKVENVAGLSEAIDAKVNSYVDNAVNTKINSYIKYKIIKRDLGSNNWFALSLDGTQCQIVSVSAVENPTDVACIFLPYRAGNGRWHARVYSASDMSPVTGYVLDVIVCYIDLGSPIDTSDVVAG